MGRAVVQRLLVDKVRKPVVKYCGLLFDKDGQDATTMIEQQVYDLWDSSGDAPPKRREHEELPAPSLDVLSWSNGVRRFPDSLFDRFVAGTAQYQELKAFKDEVVALYPDAASTSAVAGSGPLAVPRAGGRPDYSIEGGMRPVDFTRDVDPPIIRASDFHHTRPGIVFCRCVGLCLVVQ